MYLGSENYTLNFVICGCPIGHFKTVRTVILQFLCDSQQERHTQMLTSRNFGAINNCKVNASVFTEFAQFEWSFKILNCRHEYALYYECITLLLLLEHLMCFDSQFTCNKFKTKFTY